MIIEICCNSVKSASNAQNGGADRIELCRKLEVGGLTPSLEDIEYCVKTLGIRTHVLVRPRGGDFCYNDAELQEIKSTLVACRNLGVAAVVIGFLTPEGHIDTKLTKQMVELASPVEVTFHRAFDEIQQDPLVALEEVISTGCSRILTSGCKPTVTEGADTLQQLCHRAANRITILAGGGVTPQNAKAVAEFTGVTEMHGSCKQTLPDNTIETATEIVKQLKSAF